MNNIFCVFDAEKNGNISLEEMKNSLDHFQQLRQESAKNQGDDDEIN